MLPWPMMQPLEVKDHRPEFPAPWQQIACIKAGVRLEKCETSTEPVRSYYVIWCRGRSLEISNWPAAVGFCAARGVTLPAHAPKE